MGGQLVWDVGVPVMTELCTLGLRSLLGSLVKQVIDTLVIQDLNVSTFHYIMCR